jgi:L-phenylalanine/L-methionine N-acetyltransferase
MDPDTIVIRPREASDGDALARIAATPTVILGTLQMPYQSPELWRARAAESSPNLYSLVAEIDGRVIGEVSLLVNERARMRHTGGIGMMVDPEFQGRGVGRSLVDAVLDLADNWIGLHRIELQVYVDNEPAIRLYERAGFEKEGVLRDYALRAGRYVDAYTMARIRPRRDGA